MRRYSVQRGQLVRTSVCSEVLGLKVKRKCAPQLVQGTRITCAASFGWPTGTVSACTTAPSSVASEAESSVSAAVGAAFRTSARDFALPRRQLNCRLARVKVRIACAEICARRAQGRRSRLAEIRACTICAPRLLLHTTQRRPIIYSSATLGVCFSVFLFFSFVSRFSRSVHACAFCLRGASQRDKADRVLALVS